MLHSSLEGRRKPEDKDVGNNAAYAYTRDNRSASLHLLKISYAF